MASFVRMACVWSHMGLMEGAEARSAATPEVTAFVTNEGPTCASGIVEEVIVAPVAIVQRAIVAIVITVAVHRPAWADAPCQCEQRGSGQGRFQCVSHDHLAELTFRRMNSGRHNMGTLTVVPENFGSFRLLQPHKVAPSVPILLFGNDLGLTRPVRNPGVQ